MNEHSIHHDAEVEARGYAPSRLICRNDRGIRFVKDIVRYLVEMVSTSCEETMEERLRCIRIYRACALLASVATQNTTSWHHIVANTSEIFRSTLAKRDRCIKGMSGHWTSRIFQGLVVEYFNAFLRPTAYDRKEDEHMKKSKKRLSKMRKLKSIGKSMREERQRRVSVTHNLVRAGRKRTWCSSVVEYNVSRFQRHFVVRSTRKTTHFISFKLSHSQYNNSQCNPLEYKY